MRFFFLACFHFCISLDKVKLNYFLQSVIYFFFNAFKTSSVSEQERTYTQKSTILNALFSWWNVWFWLKLKKELMLDTKYLLDIEVRCNSTTLLINLSVLSNYFLYFWKTGGQDLKRVKCSFTVCVNKIPSMIWPNPFKTLR